MKINLQGNQTDTLPDSHRPPRVYIPFVIDIVMHIALQRPIAASRVPVQPTAGLDG